MGVTSHSMKPPLNNRAAKQKMIINDCQILLCSEIAENKIRITYTPVSREYSKEEREEIESEWNDAIAKYKERPGAIFNGNLFSLISWSLECGELHINLGNTNYKEYVGTRNNKRKSIPGKSSPSNPLAICASLITTDGYMVIEKRNGGDVYNDYFHVIGGFMDRDMDIGENNTITPFYSIAREIKEELGILISPNAGKTIGLVYDRRTPHPELCFTFYIDKSLDETIKQIKFHNNSEVGYVFGLKNTPAAISDFLEKNKNNTSVTGFGCLLLHGRIYFGDAWYCNTVNSLQNSGDIGNH